MDHREFVEIESFISQPAAETAVARLRAAGIEVRLVAGPMGGPAFLPVQRYSFHPIASRRPVNSCHQSLCG